MKLRYFKDCVTAEEMKKKYRDLAFMLHPDCGGDIKEFQEMQEEYKFFWELIKYTHKRADGSIYTESHTSEKPTEFTSLIDQLIKLKAQVEIIGSWIWVLDGKNIKEALKKLGFRYSPKKKAWYFHKGTFRKRTAKTYSMNEIRAIYGVQRYFSDDPVIETA